LTGNALYFGRTEVLRVHLDENFARLGVVAFLLHATVTPSITRSSISDNDRFYGGLHILDRDIHDSERFLDVLAYWVSFTGREDKVLRFGLLENAPHSLDIVLG
jgi:hypothetical protein